MYSNDTWIEIPENKIDMHRLFPDIAPDQQNHFWNHVKKLEQITLLKEIWPLPFPPMIGALTSCVPAGMVYLVFKTIPDSFINYADYNPLVDSISNFLLLSKNEAIDTLDILDRIANSIPNIHEKKQRFFRLGLFEKTYFGTHLFPVETDKLYLLLCQLLDLEKLARLGIRLFPRKTNIASFVHADTHLSLNYQVIELESNRDRIRISLWHMSIKEAHDGGTQYRRRKPGLYLTCDGVLELRDMLLQAIGQMS